MEARLESSVLIGAITFTRRCGDWLGRSRSAVRFGSEMHMHVHQARKQEAPITVNNFVFWSSQHALTRTHRCDAAAFDSH